MGLSLSGLGSGFDWQSIVSQLRQVEESQLLAPLQTQKTKQEKVLSAWSNMGSRLSDLLESVEDLEDDSDFDLFGATLKSSSSSVPAESLLSVSVGSGAGPGSYDIKITQLAKAEKLQSQSVASSSGDAGWNGSISLGGHELSLDGKSLLDMRSEINTLNSGENPTGVIASVFQVSDSDFRLILTSEEEGAAGIDLTDAAGDYFVDTPLQEGKDAGFSIDGISMTRSSNAISDAIPGVTLNLSGESSTVTLRLDLGRDQEAVEEKVQSFVDAYNGVMELINSQMKYDSTAKQTGGTLFGDSGIRSIRSRLQTTLIQAGLQSSGLTLDREGILNLDSDDLSAAFESDYEGSVSGIKDLAQSLVTVLEGLTDSVDGQVKTTKDSVQERIDHFDKRMTDLESRIDMHMERVKAKFIAMDSALSQMQSQSDWLTTQLAGLQNNS